jgi:hypothetical protein
MGWSPRVGFSLARWTISCWVSWSSGGRPVWRCGEVQAPATSRRCQRGSVSGWTKKQDQRDLGSARLTAASSAQSAGSSLGHGVWRRRTVRWWRRTRISRSLAASPRAISLSSWMERHSVR